MRIGVLEVSQNPADTPQHFVSKPLAEKFLNHFCNGKRACVRIHEALIQIACKLTFGQLKGLLKAPPRSAKYTPTHTRWDWSEPIAARYPARDQTSYQYGAS